MSATSDNTAVSHTATAQAAAVKEGANIVAFPFDVVESWSSDERFVQLIIVGELGGQEFDWDRMRWKKRG